MLYRKVLCDDKFHQREVLCERCGNGGSDSYFTPACDGEHHEWCIEAFPPTPEAPYWQADAVKPRLIECRNCGVIPE